MSEEKGKDIQTRSSLSTRLSWLRAGVLGANDGIISTAGLVIGIAAASSDVVVIATAGIAGLVAGAVSMALGEYLSVSTQRDTETALIDSKRTKFESQPEKGRDWLISYLQGQGVSPQTSNNVIEELGDDAVLRGLLRHRLGLDEYVVANPWVAAASSFLSFSIGAALPLLAIILPSAESRIPVAFITVIFGLAITGWLSAYLGESSKRKSVVRLIVGGTLAMAATYGIGYVLGVAIS